MPTVSDKTELIDAIDVANTNYNTITTIDLADDIELNSVEGTLFGPVGTPVVLGQVIINGNGYTISRIGATELRLLSVTGKTGFPDASLILNDVRLDNGDTSTSGGAGAIVNDGYLEIHNSTISNCKGLTNAGAIYNGDNRPIVISGCIFLDNEAVGSNARGGAIYNSSGSSLDIKDTIFAGNKALGTGSLGGGIYRHSSGTVQIINSSFCGNEAPTGSHIYNNGSSFNATQCWWGEVSGPDGNISGTVNYEPYRTTLPRFVATPGITENPCLPDPVPSCTLTILQNVNVRRGPSRDDPCITGATGSSCDIQALATEEYDLRAYAEDEEGNTWYGFKHPSRPYYLSWVVDTYDSIQYSEINCSTVSVPKFDTQPDNDWDFILQIEEDPLDEELDDSRNSRGFGYGDGLQAVYELVADCAHPGQDFFPVQPENVKVKAVADGIVVGIGLDSDGQRATAWGAVVSGGCNLIIRTGGHFVLYGDLESAEPHLYLGARVYKGEIIATLAEQGTNGDNTHLHLEIDAYIDTQDVDDLLRSCFGAIRYNGGENPEQVIDPLYFITDKGTYDSGGSVNNSSCTNPHKDNYDYSIYKGASINGKEFNYIVRTDIYLRGFNKTNAADDDAIDCLTAQPTDPCNR